VGVSVEDRQYGLPRIADLQSAPAAVRFLSIEPLLEDLGALDLHGIHWVKQWGGLQKKRAGRMLDGRTYDEFPERLRNPVSVADEHFRWAAEMESRYSDFGAVTGRSFGIGGIQ
jgi:hypothetical protein